LKTLEQEWNGVPEFCGGGGGGGGLDGILGLRAA